MLTFEKVLEIFKDYLALDTEAAVKDVLEKFGAERVQFILANCFKNECEK